MTARKEDRKIIHAMNAYLELDMHPKRIVIENVIVRLFWVYLYVFCPIQFKIANKIKSTPLKYPRL